MVRVHPLAVAAVLAVDPPATMSAEEDAHPLAAPGVTSLTDSTVSYRVPGKHYVVLERSHVTAVIVDNNAIDAPGLPGHRAGYNGLAALSHENRQSNVFVPAYAGLNFEHIHDGTTQGLREKFEPRAFPMELRLIDEHTVELYQAPTGNWKLESCGRYRLLEDGTIEYTFECIPRAGGYRNGYIGLFWASYIHRPERKSIFFEGVPRGDAEAASRWVEGVTPRHGIDSTHAPETAPSLPEVDAEFPLTLVNHPSPFLHTRSWYYGLSHGMALAMMFRERDRIWLAQSPSGGGQGNPAWDFQWFIPDVEVGDADGFVMRLAYLPTVERTEIEAATAPHREALNPR